MAGAHRFVELRLGKVEGSFESGAELRFAFHQLRGWRGKLSIQEQEPFAGFVAGHPQQIALGRIQVLRIARIGDPDGLTVAQDTREPIHLGQKIREPFLVIGFGKQKLLLPAAVEARRYWDRLAIAGFEKFELAQIDRLEWRCRRRTRRKAAPWPARSPQTLP